MPPKNHLVHTPVTSRDDTNNSLVYTLATSGDQSETTLKFTQEHNAPLEVEVRHHSKEHDPRVPLYLDTTRTEQNTRNGEIATCQVSVNSASRAACSESLFSSA